MRASWGRARTVGADTTAYRSRRVMVVHARTACCWAALELGRRTATPRSLASSSRAESLEEAVAREVSEEAGVRAQALLSSPLVSAVALPALPDDRLPRALRGRRAGDARRRARGLRWFTREELADPKAFHLPPPAAIARQLINACLEG